MCGHRIQPCNDTNISNWMIVAANLLFDVENINRGQPPAPMYVSELHCT